MKKFLRILTVFLATLFVFTAASCKEEAPKPQEFEGTAQDLVNLVSLKQNHSTVSSNFKVAGEVKQLDTVVEVVWTSDDTNFLEFSKDEVTDPELGKTWTATVHQSETESKIVEVTAAVTYKEETATKSFTVKVARYVRPDENLRNFYLGGYSNGDEVTVNGWLAWTSEESEFNHVKQRNIYVLDETKLGFVYGYQMSIDAELSATIKVGDPVKIVGPFDSGHGEQVFRGTIYANTKGTALETIPAMDITTDVLVNDADTMKMRTSALATVKGVKFDTVEEKLRDSENPKYKFDNTTIVKGSLGDAKVNVTASKYILDKAGADAVLAKAQGLKGKSVDVTGFVRFFNGTPELQVLSVDDIVEGTALVEDDTVKMAKSLNEAAAKIASSYDAATEVALLTKGTKYDTVALSYDFVAPTEFFEIVNGKLVVKASEEYKEAKIKITATLGEKTLTRTVATSVITIERSTWEKFVAAENGVVLPEIKATVTVVHARYSSSYKTYTYTFILQDENGAYYFKQDGFSKADVDKYNALIVAGHEVTMTGVTKKVDYGKHLLDKIEDATIVLGAEKTVTPLDLNEYLKNADVKDEQLSLLVTAKGTLGEVDDKDAVLTIGSKTIKVRMDDKLIEPITLPTGEVTIVGVLNDFKGTKQINPLTITGGEVAPEPEKPETPTYEFGELDVTKDYQLVLNHTKIEKVLYFAGKMNGFYYDTVEDATKQVTLKAEVKGEGYALYFMDGEAKKYINVGPRDGKDYTKSSLSIDAESKTLYKYVPSLETVFAVLNAENSFVFGTKKTDTYTTIGAENITKIDSTAVCKLTVSEGGAVTPPAPTLTEFTGVITAANKTAKAILVQNAEGAKEVRVDDALLADFDTLFVIGKTVTVKGELNEKNGLEFLLVTDKTNVSALTDGTVPAVKDITEAVKTAADDAAVQEALKPNLSAFVTFKNAKYDGSALLVDGHKVPHYTNAFTPKDLIKLQANAIYDVRGYVTYFKYSDGKGPGFQVILTNLVLVDDSQVVTSDLELVYGKASAHVDPADGENFADKFPGIEGLTITCAKGSSSNAFRLDKGGSFHFYGSQNNQGNSLTIAVAGKKISKVIINYGQSDKEILSIGDTVCNNNDIVELATPADSITITCTGTKGVFATAIKIIYAK